MKPQAPAGAPRAVQVALPVPLRQTFSYAVPEGWPVPSPGCRVRVSFAGRRLVGMVVEDDAASPPASLKPLDEALDAEPLLPPDLLEFTRRVADYYLVPWGAVIRCAYPSGLDPSLRARFRAASQPPGAPPDHISGLLDALAGGPLGRAALRGRLGPTTESLLQEALRDGFVEQEGEWKTRRAYAGGDRVALLAPPGEARALAEDPHAPKPVAKAMRVLLDWEAKGFPTVAAVASAARVPQRVLHEMAGAGLVELFDLVPARLPGQASPHALSPGQAEAVAAVAGTMDAGAHATFLLFGVTASGKTEVYMDLVDRALAAGRTALYLVPEISLTSFLARRLLQRFGSRLAILHSAMTEHERVRQWRRVAAGRAPVVIGPRSALFAPLPGLGLIVVDEEHDGSYKQQEFPRYHARDMAVVRGLMAGAPVVLGSATPSVESFYNATEAGKYRLLRLPERVTGASLPPVTVADMRAEFAETGARATLSRALAAALEAALAEGRQAVLLRNRLGYATFVLCRQCGRTLQCRDCSVALTFHRRPPRLQCHYCGRREPVPETCPHCGGEVLQFRGEGTETVEEALAAAFPDARVARMDREAVRTGARFDALWRAFEAGSLDVLVGTQMVAKGNDVPNVTLVGILSADFLLGMPDFRAAERVFQLITQAAGRSGRGRFPGTAVLQSFHPDHYAVEAAVAHDFEAFYAKDIRYRKMMGYPPVSALARIEIRHASPARLASLATDATAALRAAALPGVRVLGPMEPPLPRLEGLHRLHVLLRAPERQRLRAVLSAFLDGPAGRHNGRELLVEVDPYDLM